MTQASRDYETLRGVISKMRSAAGRGETAERCQNMIDMLDSIENQRRKAEDMAETYRLAAIGARFESEKREIDAYVRGLADGFSECAEDIAKK